MNISKLAAAAMKMMPKTVTKNQMLGAALFAGGLLAGSIITGCGKNPQPAAKEDVIVMKEQPKIDTFNREIPDSAETKTELTELTDQEKICNKLENDGYELISEKNGNKIYQKYIGETIIVDKSGNRKITSKVSVTKNNNKYEDMEEYVIIDKDGKKIEGVEIEAHGEHSVYFGKTVYKAGKTLYYDENNKLYGQSEEESGRTKYMDVKGNCLYYMSQKGDDVSGERFFYDEKGDIKYAVTHGSSDNFVKIYMPNNVVIEQDFDYSYDGSTQKDYFKKLPQEPVDEYGYINKPLN